jgi:hypothetical protein
MSNENRPQPTPEILLRQYEIHADLFKAYLDLVMKANGFYYVITGAILAFFAANRAESAAKLALVLPLALSVGLSVLAFYAVGRARIMRDEFDRIVGALGLKVLPEVRILSALLLISASGALIVALFIMWLLACYAPSVPR